jgi:hypothetical protein
MKTKNNKAISTLIAVTIAFSVLVAFSATASAATTWYVSTTGNDISGDGSAGNPWKTITYALTQVSAGDTIIVGPGTYVEYTGNPSAGCAVMVPWYAEGAGGLTIQSSDGPENTIIDCGWAGWGVQIVSNDITFEGFTVKNAYSLINQVGGNDHVLNNLILTDFVNYGMSVMAAHDCTFSDITIHTNDVSNSNNRLVKGIDIQEYGSGGNTYNTFEDITIYDIETTGTYGTSMGIYFEGDNPDTHPTTGNTFTNIAIYDLASEDFNCGVYILDTGYYTGTGNIDPYAIEDTTFSGGSIYGFTENGVNVVSRGFYVKGGNKNLDITCFDITGCDDGVYFRSFAGTIPPTFPPTSWINDDSWVASKGSAWVKPRTGTYAAGIEICTSTPDDYLIMPQQSITTGDSVSLYARGSFMFGSAQFKLLVSTTGTNQADFTDTLGIYPVSGYLGGSWSHVSEDLSAYDGQDIYIAIYAYEQESGPSSELLIDDVTLPDGTTEGFESTPTTIGAVDVSVNYNNIHGNTNYGADNSDGVGTIDAEHNWWGHASGPSGPDGRTTKKGKVIGKGDAVSANVDWDPWLPQPVGHTPHDPVPPGLRKGK